MVGLKNTEHDNKKRSGNAKHLNVQHGLIFPETRVEMDVSGATTLADTIAKIQDNLFLTGSISTFQTTATKTSHAPRKSMRKIKTGTTVTFSTTDTDMALSLATFSE